MNLPANQFELPEEHSNLSRMFFKYMNRGGSETMYWATVPLLSDKKNPSGDSNQALESWKRWNSFRLQCDQHPRYDRFYFQLKIDRFLGCKWR